MDPLPLLDHAGRLPSRPAGRPDVCDAGERVKQAVCSGVPAVCEALPSGP